MLKYSQFILLMLFLSHVCWTSGLEKDFLIARSFGFPSKVLRCLVAEVFFGLINFKQLLLLEIKFFCTLKMRFNAIAHRFNDLKCNPQKYSGEKHALNCLYKVEKLIRCEESRSSDVFGEEVCFLSCGTLYKSINIKY